MLRSKTEQIKTYLSIVNKVLDAAHKPAACQIGRVTWLRQDTTAKLYR